MQVDNFVLKKCFILIPVDVQTDKCVRDVSC